MKKITLALATLITLPLSCYANSEVEKSEVTVGLVSQYAPKYMGSKNDKTDFLPYFDWTRGSWFANSEKGVGYQHQFDTGFYLGQALGYAWGRADDDSWYQDGSRHLKGMGKINAAMTSTTTLGWWMAEWIGFESNIIAPLTDSQGMQYKIGLNVVLFNDGDNTLVVNTERKYGDARFNNTWFGVNEKQSQNSGFKPFRSDWGLNSVDYSINWQHTFNPNWSGYAEVRYTTLASRVSHSPLVEKDDFVTGTLGVFYTF